MSLPFSDTSNKNGLIQLFEGYTGLGDGAVSGSATLLKIITGYINVALQKLITTILESQDDWDWDDGTITSTYPVATRALVAAQRDYKFSSVFWSLIGVEGGSAGSNAAIAPLKIRRVDITYDGTNWYRVTPFDSSQVQLGLGNDTVTDGRYSKSGPAYDLRDNAIWIYPEASASDVTSGAKVRIEFLREPTAYVSSDTTKTAPIDTAFVPMLPIDAAITYCITNAPSLVPGLQGMYADLEARLRRYYSRKDEDTVYQFRAARINYD